MAREQGVLVVSIDHDAIGRAIDDVLCNMPDPGPAYLSPETVRVLFDAATAYRDIDAALAKARAEGAAETQREIVAWLREAKDENARMATDERLTATHRQGLGAMALAFQQAADRIERTTFTGRARVEPGVLPAGDTEPPGHAHARAEAASVATRADREMDPLGLVELGLAESPKKPQHGYIDSQGEGWPRAKRMRARDGTVHYESKGCSIYRCVPVDTEEGTPT